MRVVTKLIAALAVLCLTFVLVGCASDEDAQHYSHFVAPGSSIEVSAQPEDIQYSLAKAAQDVSTAMQNLATIQKSAYPENQQLPYTDMSVGVALKQPISIQWYGPIKPALERVASAVGYKLQVYGKQPGTPILVDVNTMDSPEPAVSVIRNIDLQAGLNASVLLFPKRKIISLRYI